MRNYFRLKQRKLILQQTGDVLIEAVLGIAITGIVVTGIVVALSNSISHSNLSRDQNRASNYAQEGLEIARNMKESNFNNFLLLEDGSYCLSEGALTIESEPSDGCEIGNYIDGVFSRTVYISKDGIDKRGTTSEIACENTNPSSETSIFVASTVTWTDSRCPNGEMCHRVELNSCFVDLDTIR